MHRMVFVIAAFALMASTPLPVHISVQVERTSLEALDDVAFRIIADNMAPHPISVHFASPNEYEFDLLRGGKVVWKSIPAYNGVTKLPGHAKLLFPGTHPIVTYDWSGILSDGFAPKPGRYTLRATLLIDQSRTTTNAFQITPSLPILGLTHLATGTAATISGVLAADAQHLSDASGEVMLFRKLLSGVHPGDVVVARGYMQRPRGGTQSFLVTRFAPLIRAAVPALGASPTPMMIPCGPHATPCRTFHSPVPSASPNPHRFL